MAIRIKPALLAIATRLHRVGLMRPVFWASWLLWRISGRTRLTASIAFWSALLTDRLDHAAVIQGYAASMPDRAGSHAWAARAGRALEDRSPVDPEMIRAGVPARSPRRAAPAGVELAYVLASSLPHLQSGYAQRADRLARALLRAGTTLYCVTRPGFPDDVTGLTATPQADGPMDGAAPVWHRIAQPTLRDLVGVPYIMAAADALEEVLRQRDPAVVMAASSYLTALPALIAARRLGVPFLYEVRGFWEVTRASRTPGYDQSLRFRNAVALETLTAQEADRVLTLNRPMRQELIRRGVEASSIGLLSNAFDPSSFTLRPRDAALCDRYGLPEGVPVLGFAGSFTAYEGLDDLIVACGLLKQRGLDFRLVLVGDEVQYSDVATSLLSRLKSLVAAHDLQGRVVLPGRVPAPEVPRWYSVFDIAPFPRKPMAVAELVPPLKPVEAMGMGKAVIASDVGALADLVQDGVTGLLFAKGDVVALANGLERLLRDPQLRARLGANGREWARANRTWDTVAASLRRVVAELIRDPR